jgi:transglutaminase-like putative cysteine protease
MRIRYGFAIDIEIDQPTTLLTALDVERARRGDLVSERGFSVAPATAFGAYTDVFGNLRRRIYAQPGVVSLRAGGVIEDAGEPDIQAPEAAQVAVTDLPVDTLPFLLGSRYCETDLLGEFACARFGAVEGGWAKAQAVCDFVHRRVRFSRDDALASRSAAQTLRERVGVGRDFAHLAIALCRCVDIPARYCSGYLGAAPAGLACDLNAWFEAYVGGAWRTFDARHNAPQVGRIVVARGRDAMDIPMLHAFGAHILRRCEIMTEELPHYAVSFAAE